MKNVIKRFSFLLAGLVMSSTMIFAQENKFLLSHYRIFHEVGIWGGGGTAGLNMDKKVGSTSNKFQPSAGLSYTFWVSNQIGIGTGVEYTMYNTKFELDDISDHFTSDLGSITTNIRGYEEQIEMNMVKIPLMLNFQTYGESARFQVAVGAKIGLPMQGKYKVKDMNYTYAVNNGPEQEGFPLGSMSKDLDLKMSFMASAELGVKFALSRTAFMYLGGYIDYGLNNMQKQTSGTRLIDLVENEPFHGSVTNAQYAPTNTGSDTKIVSKINNINMGAKLRISFGFGVEKITKNAQLREYLRDKYQDDKYSSGKYEYEGEEGEEGSEEGEYFYYE